MKNDIRITRETMLKNAIFRSLIGYSEDGEFTIPGEIKGEIQKYIISDFKTQLRMNGDNSFLKSGNKNESQKEQ